MSWWRRLFGIKPPRAPMHLGDFEGNEEEVVGESHYQANLARLAERHPPDRARLREVVATLVHEDNNAVDSLAIRVDIEGLTVGYLTRMAARQYRQWLAAGGHPGRTATCAARIIGGWDRAEGGRAYFGVELDVPSFYGPPPRRESPR
jgi:hypothetical protein